MNFFSDKILKIRGTINDQVKTTWMTEISDICAANATQLTNFKPATIEEVDDHLLHAHWIQFLHLF